MARAARPSRPSAPTIITPMRGRLLSAALSSASRAMPGAASARAAQAPIRAAAAVPSSRAARFRAMPPACAIERPRAGRFCNRGHRQCKKSAMARRRILVTGGSGFLGSHLCELVLGEGHEVVCLDNFFTGTRANVEHLLDNHRFELMRHDVTDALTMEVDEIFHLACPALPIHYQRNPVRTIRTAVEGTLNMLDLAREAHARILIASTSEVYGDPIEHPQHESYWGNVNPIGPRACYDEGKRCAEALAVSYARQYAVEVRIARIFNTYGPRMHENDGRVASNFN